MSKIADIMEYNEEVEKINKRKKAKEIYYRNRESHLKAQKKYDDKNREKKHEYDKKRYIQMKEYKQEIERLNNIRNELEEYLKQRKEEWNNSKNKEEINSYHYIMLIRDLLNIIQREKNNG